MSQQIDNQIVKMQFDNASFEKNAQQSMSTLDKLKQALKFEKVNLTPLQQAFSETEATATKAGFHIRDIWLKVGNIIEQEVAQKVVDAGKKMLNALSFEGINDGFKEYELKMGSIQTIMAGTGESLATVNKYLDDLNTYSDRTIYSFSDMTQNIGKFTNAGVKLRDAVDAIKGIANEAAVSGANANEASRAMYNFAQALSAGYVKLIDWKSIENANMATKEFKESLLDVAVACGTVEKTSDGMYRVLTENNKGSTMDDLVSGTKNFNDSLQYQWMTTEVLTKTLKLYATDVRTLSDEERNLYEQELKNLGLNEQQIEHFEQLGIKATDAASEIKTFSMMMDTLKEAIGSGWAMTWQIMIGDFEQAKALWTNVGNTLSGVIDGMSDARNRFLRAGLQTGWEEFTTLEDRAIPQAEKFREVLVDLARDHGVLSKDQYIAINSTETLMKSFHELGWVTGDLLTEAVSDYTNILESMSDAEIDEFGIKPSDVEQLKRLNKELQDGTINADDFAKKMTELGGRENVLKGLSNIFHALLDSVRPIGEAFDEVFGIMDPQKLFDLTQRFRDFTEQLKVSDEAANTIKTSFTLVFGAIKNAIGTLGTAFNGVSKLVLPVLNLFDAVFGVIGKIISALTGSKGALDVADKFTKIGDKIGSKYLSTMQKLADFINKVADAIRNLPEATIFTKIHDGVDSAISSLKEFWEEFKELPVVQQMVADFNNTVASIERKVTPVVNSVKRSLDDLKAKVKATLTMETLNKFLTDAYNKVKKVISVVKDFGERVKKFFTNLKEGKSVVESFRDTFGDIIDRVKELKDNLMKFFDDLFSKGDELGTTFNLEAIQQAIHEFVTNITPEQVTMIAVASTFMLIAINLLRLSDAMRNAVEAFTGIGVALKNVINSYIKKQKSTILQVAEAIVIVAAALWVLSTVPKDKLENATTALITLTACLGALTIALTACGVAMHLLGGEKSMVELASGLAIVAGSFMIVTGALKVLEYVNLEGIVPKLITMAVIMTALVGLSVLMGKLDKFSKGSLTMLAVSGALLLTAESLNRLSDIPTEKLDKSIEAMLKMMLGLAAVTVASGQVGVFSAVGLIAVVLTLDKILPLIEKIVNYDYEKINEGLTKNEQVLKKLGVVVGAMVIVGALAGNRLKGAGIAMLSIATTFGILVGVAKLASMMRPSELRQGEQFILKMAGIIALLELCSSRATLGKFGGKNGGEGSKVFIRLSITMGILLSIAKLASMMSVADIAKGELAVLGLVGLIGAMVFVAGKAKNSEGVIRSVSAMLFALSLILGEVAVLSVIPLGNMLPALGAILSILTALGFLALAISKTNKVFDKATMKASGAGTMIAAMILVAAMGAILVQLSKSAPKNVMTAAIAMTGVIGAVALLSKALGDIPGGGNGTQAQVFLESTLMVALVAGVIGILSDYVSKNNIDPNTMLKAGASIALVIAAITPALAAMSLFSKAKYDYAAMGIAIGGAIGALIIAAGAIGLLSNYGGDSDKMIASAEALALTLVAVCVPIAVLGTVGAFVKDVKAGSMTAVVIGAIGTLAAVSAALIAISNLGNSDNLVQSSQALAIGLLAVSVPIAVLGVVGKLCNTIAPGGLRAMAIAIVGAIGAMYAISDILIDFSHRMDTASLQILTDSIPVLITAVGSVAALAIAISVAGMIPGNAIAGATAMVAALGVFAIVIAAIGLLGAAINQDVLPVKESIEAGLDFLIIIAGKLGEAAGALIGGIGAGIASQLDPIADDMVNFSEKMITFSKNIKQVDQDVVSGCANIASAMLKITAASFIEGLTRWIGLGHPIFDFESLGKAVAAFCRSTADVSEDAVKKANTCSIIAKRLAEISSTLDATGGVAGWLFGEKDLGAFADNVKKLGIAIKGFCDKVSGLPENAVEMAQRAADSASPMIELTKTLTSNGGIIQKIVGEKNLGTFGENLSAFVTSLTRFVTRLTVIEGVASNYPELVKRCADAMTPMVNLADGIRLSGGKLQEFIGEGTLDVFGKTLGPFAEGLRDFVSKLNEMATTTPNYVELIAGSVAATKQLIELANSLENMGGVAAAFTGDNTLSKFGQTLPPFGACLASYSAELATVDTTIIDSATLSIIKLIDLGAKAAGVPVTAFDGLIAALGNLAKLSLNAMLAEIIRVTPLIVTAFTDLINKCTTLVTNRTISDQHYYKEYGTRIDTGMEDGIKSNAEKVTTALKNLTDSIISSLDESMKESNFTDYGANVSIGLANGISAHIEDAVNAAEALASAVNAAIPPILKEHSPSRVAYGFGGNYSIGLANGITDYAGQAVNAAANMSTDIVNVANDVISSILDLLNSDVDMNPVIRPVLDTSDIADKVRNIGKMFSSSDLALAYNASASMKANADAQNKPSGVTNNAYTYGGATIYVTARDGESADQIADRVINKLDRAMNRRKAVNGA